MNVMICPREPGNLADFGPLERLIPVQPSHKSKNGIQLNLHSGRDSKTTGVAVLRQVPDSVSLEAHFAPAT
jgi:hypothetical protein